MCHRHERLVKTLLCQCQKYGRSLEGFSNAKARYARINRLGLCDIKISGDYVCRPINLLNFVDEMCALFSFLYFAVYCLNLYFYQQLVVGVLIGYDVKDLQDGGFPIARCWSLEIGVVQAYSSDGHSAPYKIMLARPFGSRAYPFEAKRRDFRRMRQLVVLRFRVCSAIGSDVGHHVRGGTEQ